MNDTGTYEEREFPTFRNPTVDTLDQGHKKHHVPFLFEVDVTEGRKYLHELRARTGEAISFTGWVMSCIGKAVSNHKFIHALRKGGRRLILFDDVDISVVVESSVGHGDRGSETLPALCGQKGKREERQRDSQRNMTSHPTRLGYVGFPVAPY